MKNSRETMPKNNSDDWSLLSTVKYSCSFPNCDLQFKRKDRLDTHEYTHSHVKKFKCTEIDCNKAYITASHLQRHKRTSHAISDEKVYCSHESCGKFFDSIAGMEAHRKIIHSEKSLEFECEICNEKFRRKTHLKQHLFEHTGHYRYTCDECEKGFLMMSRLKRHKNSHRTRHCDECGATFDKWSLLVAHKSKDHLNSELKCSICDREFHSKRLLKEHRKIHVNSDERIVYQCPFEGCTKTFLQNHNVLTHYKSKHENLKFPCTYDDCTMECSTKQKLNLHIKVVHLGEVPKKTKQKRKRAARKDKGVQKISTASKFFKFILPPAFEQAIIAGQGKNIHIEHNNQIDDDENGIGDMEITELATVKFTERVIEC